MSDTNASEESTDTLPLLLTLGDGARIRIHTLDPLSEGSGKGDLRLTFHFDVLDRGVLSRYQRKKRLQRWTHNALLRGVPIEGLAPEKRSAFGRARERDRAWEAAHGVHGESERAADGRAML